MVGAHSVRPARCAALRNASKSPYEPRASVARAARRAARRQAGTALRATRAAAARENPAIARAAEDRLRDPLGARRRARAVAEAVGHRAVVLSGRECPVRREWNSFFR